MTDLSITAANVKPGAGARIDRSAQAGEAIERGMGVVKYNGVWMKADNNHATAALNAATGIALNDAAQYQPIDVQTEGEITIGGTMTAGLAYFTSATAGGICPYADLSTGMKVSLIGLSKSTTVLKLGVIASGVTL